MANNQNNETSVTFKVFNKQFKDGLKENTAEAKKLRQEMKLEQEQLKLNGTESEKLTSKMNGLQQQYELAQQKTKATRDALEEAKALYGENSEAVSTMETALNNAQIQETKLANQIGITSQKLDEAKNKESDRTQQLDSLKSQQDKLESSSEKLTKQYELQTAELGENASESQKAKIHQQYLTDQMKNSADQVKNLEDQLALAKKQFGENSTEVDKLEKELLDAKIASQEFSNEYKTATDTLGNFSNKAKEVGDKMETVGKKWTMGVSVPIAAGVGLSVKAASDFESAFAGVKKTVDEAVDANGRVTVSYADLEEGIRKMAQEIPSSAAEISEVAESAGQLGIQTKNVLSFTETMIAMGVATDMSATDAATALARFANITQMSQNDFDRLGSVITELGNNFATTESEITNMGLRLAGAGSQVGLSESQIMSFAAALSSVGIEAEAGGSAFSKVMVEMQLAAETGGESLDNFAQVAGMSSEQFKQAFQEDAAGAIIAFIQGLSEAEANGTSAIKVLDDMGITEVRLRDALLRASGASDVFTEAIQSGSSAWDENTALSEEAEKRYDTFESKLQMLKNKFTDLAIEIGGPFMDALSDAIDALGPVFEVLGNLARAFSEADPATQKLIMTFLAIVVAVGPVLIALGKMATAVGAIAGLFGAKGALAGVVPFFTKTLLPALGKFIGAIVGWPLVIGLAVAGVAYLIYKYWDEIVAFFEDLGEWFGEFFSNLGTAISDKWTEITTAVSETVGGWKDAVVGKVTEMKDGIVGVFTTVKQWFSDTWTSIKDTTINLWNQFITTITPIVQFFVDAIMVPISLIQTVLEAVWLTIQAAAEIAWAAIGIAAQTAWNLIQQYITTPIVAAYDWIVAKFEDLGLWLSEKWLVIQEAASYGWSLFKEYVIAPVQEAFDWVVGKFTELSDWMDEKWTSISTFTSEKWTGIKEAVTGRFTEAKDSVIGTASDIWTGITTKFDEIVNGTKTKFNQIKEAIVTPINEAKDKVKDTINNIVDFFRNIKFPKFSLKKNTTTVLGKEITYPSGIDVKWNAKGALFTKKGIYGAYAGQMQGLGEAGDEVALPLTNDRLSQIGKSIFASLNKADIFTPMLDGLVDAAKTKMALAQQPQQENGLQTKMLEMMNQFMELIANQRGGEITIQNQIGSLNTNGMAEYDKFNRDMQKSYEIADSGLRG